MARRGIVATLQPQFVTSDTWTAQRLGRERARWAYPFRSMIDAGIPVTLSSDCPVERLDTFAAIASALGRADWSSTEQTITADRRLIFCNVQNPVWGTFLVTGLDKVFAFSENVTTALATLQMGQ